MMVMLFISAGIVCVRVCVHTRRHMHLSACVCVVCIVCVCVCVCARARRHMHLSVCVCVVCIVCVCVYVCVRMCVCVCLCVHLCLYAYLCCLCVCVFVVLRSQTAFFFYIGVAQYKIRAAQYCIILYYKIGAAKKAVWLHETSVLVCIFMHVYSELKITVGH